MSNRWGGRNPPQRGREEREAAEAAARDAVVEAALGMRGMSRPGCTCRLCVAVDALLALQAQAKEGGDGG